MQLKVSELVKRATAAGVDGRTVAEAMDSDDPRAAFVEILTVVGVAHDETVILLHPLYL